ncbi:MAG: hypothetical protein EPO28_00540 [Saprospiraceae bacterium]|nr:MAG: hypothetical protein EPO28_00540 [Saprospiraceae bacterium]
MRRPHLFHPAGDPSATQPGGYDLSFAVGYDFQRRAKRAGYDFGVLPCKCTVSARKYERNSWLRAQIANLVACNLWPWGAWPGRSG